MNDSTIHVGLDVHKESIVAAYSIGLGEVQNLGHIGVRQHDLDRLCTRLRSKGSRVCCVYEPATALGDSRPIADSRP